MSDPVPFLDEAVAAPIAGPSAAGRDLTYDPIFEQLSAEIEKTTSMAGETPDWGLVRRESGRILKEDSKDLRIASWWVASGAITEGWGAIATGAVTYQAILERYWAEMFPPVKRARARGGLVTWLWEQLAKSIPARAVTIADGDAVKAFEAAVNAIDNLLTERIGDANGGIGGVRAIIRDKIRSIPEPSKPVDPFAPPAAGAEPSPAAAPRSIRGAAVAAIPAPSAGPVGSLEAAEAAAEGWRGSLATLAQQARGTSPTSAWPYRLSRIAAWLTLNSPPDVEGGKTFARAPKAGERADLQGMFDAGAWEGLRDACEDILSEHPLWLDPHRWSAIALERLGPPFAAARDAVGRETAALVSRIPALPSLFFSNGTPFASPDTATWLQEEQARFGGGGAGAARSSSSDDATTALLADAEARIAAGQVAEGLGTAIELANNAANASTRFRAQLQAAKAAHRAGKGDLALALLERLLPQVDATLEAWLPAVCADFFETSLRVVRSVSPDWGDRQTLLFRRLLQVDPAAALRIG